MGRLAGARARARGQTRRGRRRRHPEPDGRHDARGGRLRGRRRRPLPGRHRRGQAGRGGGRGVLGRQALSDAHRGPARHHAGCARDSDEERLFGGGRGQSPRPRARRRGPPLGRLRRAQVRGPDLVDRRALESADAPGDPRPSRCGGSLDQFAALGRRRPAHRPVRRIRRGQVGAARHDDALHQGRRDRRRTDRRARPRGAGFRQQYLGSRRHAPRRGGRDPCRQSAAHAAARRVARDRHRRVFPRPGIEGPAACSTR